MNSTLPNIPRRARRPWAAAVGFLASIALGGMLGSSALGAEYMMPRNSEGLPPEGGVPAAATLKPTVVTPTNATLSWYGLHGFYTVQMSTNLTDWTNVASTAATDHDWSLTVTNPGLANANFRLAQANAFSGSGTCAGCHGNKFNEYMGTRHASAYSSIANMPPAVRENCVVCHTVGKGQQTGFVDINTTPQLANVGCENCHGAAAWHKYSDHDLIRPAVSIDPAICGSCHQDSHHPTYEEYKETLHAEVNEDIKYGLALAGTYHPETINVGGTNLYGFFLSTNSSGQPVTNRTTGIVHSLNGPQAPGRGTWLYDPGQDRAAQCGVCHSAATRMAMLKDYEARQQGYTNALEMAEAHTAGEWTATCATCHDPHSAENVAQLRYPTRSTNYYTMPTTTDKRTILTTNFQGAITTNIAFYGSTFSSLYDPSIQVCGQCHNSRGARWDGRSYGLVTNAGVISVALTTNVSISRPPHHSPQYNMLIGIVQPDYLNTNTLGVATNFTARHSGLTANSSGIYNTNQCATCHMPSYAVTSTTNVTGHSFEFNRLGCALGGCHTGGVPDVEGWQFTTTNNLRRLVELLNQWATTKASNYIGVAAYNSSLVNSWEFNPPGALASITNAGPSGANQVKLPTDILQARFNAYMVLHDGSLGVHNPGYTRLLLKDAENKVLNQYSGAKFTANSQNVFTNVLVTFTNLTVGATDCTWDFGDGTPTVNTLETTVTHAFASQGTFTVKLTATTPSGTDTMTRTAYILAYEKPIPSFTPSATTGPVPLTVTFNNTSQNAFYYNWRFMYPASIPNSNDENPSFTYTNAGTYQVRLQAYNEGGSVAVTNIITVTP